MLDKIKNQYLLSSLRFCVIMYGQIKGKIVMNTKVEKLKKGIDILKQQKVVLYHVITPINQQQFSQIEKSGYFEPSKNALGGQSDGHYFFTTKKGVDYHVKTTKDTWGQDVDKHAYIVECETDASAVKYPDWKLDYEATQDFLFDMIYNVAIKHDIKFDNIEIKALEGKKLALSYDGTFSRIKSFSPDKHTGVIEKVADFLYNHDATFKSEYDKLLQDVLLGVGDDQELYAIKTQHKQKITKVIEIENEPVAASPINSQIDKFLSRYGRGKR